MKRIVIDIDEKICREEFQKNISFVSEAILSYEWSGSSLFVCIEDDADGEVITEAIKRISAGFINSDIGSEVYFKNSVEKDMYFDVYAAENNNIIEFGNGQLGFKEMGVFLFDYFDSRFESIALSKGAAKKIYPVLLPVSDYQKTGYIRKSPQYAMFCCSASENMNIIESIASDMSAADLKKDLSEPLFALSPSACFHTYIEYKNKELDRNTLLTFRQNVFRNEGRLNYSETGRLMDYHVREIVMIGDDGYVNRLRKEIMDAAADLIKELGLRGDITTASDPFVLPRMQRYKKLQKLDRSKYEVHLNTSADTRLSAASFNLHGRAFTDPFNIAVKGHADTVTACVGFGIQRWVIAFLAQYGFDEKNWPEGIRFCHKVY